MNKMSEEGGRHILFCLKNSLRSRLARFLFVAEPTFLLVVMPKRRFMRLLGQISIVKWSVLRPVPLLNVFLNSKGLSSFSSLPRLYFFIRRSLFKRNGRKEWREKAKPITTKQPTSFFLWPSFYWWRFFQPLCSSWSKNRKSFFFLCCSVDKSSSRYAPLFIN